MYVWADELRPVLPLLRMGRGKMMGVDHNKGLRWVGASAALIEKPRGEPGSGLRRRARRGRRQPRPSASPAAAGSGRRASGFLLFVPPILVAALWPAGSCPRCSRQRCSARCPAELFFGSPEFSVALGW